MTSETEVHADDDDTPLTRRDVRDLARAMVLLRRDVAALREAQKQAPAWLSRWVGGPRELLLWVALAASLLRGDVGSFAGLLTGWGAARAPAVVSTPVAPAPAAQETVP